MPTATPSPTPPGSATPGPTPQVTGNVFYVSRHGSNGDSIPINLNNLDEDCIHTDGLQIYDGGEVTGVVMKDSIIGPGFMNAIILGPNHHITRC